MVNVVVQPARRFRLRAAPQPYCQVCFAPQTRLYVARERPSGRRISVRECDRCGYVELPDNREPGNRRQVAERDTRPRSAQRRERELAMARLGIEVLARSELSVVVCGYGGSESNPRVARLPEVAHLLAQDVAAISDDREFVGDGPAGGERFDIVVAEAVVERFDDPHIAFAKLFSLLADDGVLICSSRLYTAGDLEHQRHRFNPGQASHYSPKSLRRIAGAHNLRVDFRPPPRGAAAGRRTRFVIFSRSRDVMDAVSDYFGRHLVAPPDAPTA